MLQTQIDRLDSLVSLTSRAIESEGFVPTVQEARFVLNALVDCVDALKSLPKEEQSTDHTTIQLRGGTL